MAEQTVEEVLSSFPPFAGQIDAEYRASNANLTTLQMNIGYKCNLACRHCHLQCSPKRDEEMGRETMQACLDACIHGGFKTLDITGGAPEMNPHLQWLIEQASALKLDTVVRTNLTILLEPEYEHYLDVYAENDVHLFASLPYYAARNCDKIRGSGVFDNSIKVLRKLNELGYGTGKHVITLVFNPAGPILPPDSSGLEAEYRMRLKHDFDIDFSNLVSIANMPCGRFAEALNRKDRLKDYVQQLVDVFNPDTVPAMMCRDQISVDWQGKLYDCDFNQAMGLPMLSGETIFDWVDRDPQPRNIAFRNWCYTCTAGAGSS